MAHQVEVTDSDVVNSVQNYPLVPCREPGAEPSLLQIYVCCFIVFFSYTSLLTFLTCTKHRRALLGQPSSITGPDFGEVKILLSACNFLFNFLVFI